MQVFTAINFLLSLLQLHPIKLGMQLFCFHSSYFIHLIEVFSHFPFYFFSLTHWLFRSVFNFHIFMDFPEFLLLIISILVPLCLQNIPWVISIPFKFIEARFIAQHMVCPEECSTLCLSWLFILLLLGGVFYRYNIQICQVWLIYCFYLEYVMIVGRILMNS